MNLKPSSSPFRGSGGCAMILAAGLGTRLKPWTDHHPKALAIVNGKSLLQRNVEYLQQYGITNVVVNVHHFADQIIEAIQTNAGWGSNIIISDEQDEVLETGGGLLKAAPLLESDQSFVLMNVDILTDLDLGAMMEFHKQHNPLATLATTNRHTSRWLLFDEEDKLCGWRNTSPLHRSPLGPEPLHGVERGEEPSTQIIAEKGDPQRLKGKVTQKGFSGIHIINPKIFSLIKQQGKFSVIDVYIDLMNDHTIKSFDHSGDKVVDVGKPQSVMKAEEMFP